MKTVRFRGEDCKVRLTNYAKSKRTAIQLVCEDGSPMATASVNVPLADDEVIIKDWFENNGVLQAMIDAGIVEDTERVVLCGYELGNVCRLLV